MLEGMSEAVVDLAKYAYRSRLTWTGLMMLRGGLLQLKEVTDWRQYGGAPILGFNHLCIKAHGRSNGVPGERDQGCSQRRSKPSLRSIGATHLCRSIEITMPSPPHLPLGYG